MPRRSRPCAQAGPPRPEPRRRNAAGRGARSAILAATLAGSTRRTVSTAPPPPTTGSATDGAASEPLYRLLEALGIRYRVTEHAAAFTVEQADHLYGHLPGAHSKNLFLRNKRGDRHYLVVVLSHKQVDIRALRERLGESTLSFASAERLQRHLGLSPGSVSPFGLIHDPGHAVRVIVDRELLGHEQLNFHPNRNTATLTLSSADFQRFLAHCGHELRLLDFAAGAAEGAAAGAGDGAP
jgi:Ala-tRNA(Pro) deacylase